jgi:hypothetical protein
MSVCEYSRRGLPFATAQCSSETAVAKHFEIEMHQSENIKDNRTCENCDPMKLELWYIESTLTECHSCHRLRIPF